MKFPLKRLLLLLVLSLPAAVPGLRAQQLDLHGALELDHISYFERGPDREVVERNQGQLTLALRTTFSRHAAAYSAVELRADQAAPGRSRAYLDEAYLDLYLGRFDVRIGKQINLWGRADGINPTDNLNPFDYTDLLDTEDERIGVVALKAAYYVGDWKLEGVVPLFTPSRLPGPGSRWFPALPAVLPHPLHPEATVGAVYELRPTRTPEGLARAQVAARVSSSRAGWDVSLSYYNGWNDLPVYRPSAALDSSGLLRIAIQPEHYRLQAFGGDFATTVGAFGLRGEAAYFRSSDPEEPPYLQYVLGIDRSFGGLTGKGSLFVLVQWIHEVSGGDRPERVIDLNHLFRKAVSTRLAYGLTGRVSCTVQGVVNLDEGDYLVQPEVAYQATDRIDVRVSTDLLGGQASSFFGGFDENNRLQVRLRYRF